MILKRKKSLEKEDNKAPKKRISIIRLLIFIIVIAGVIYYATFSIKNLHEEVTAVKTTPWFAPYVDVTATPQYDFEKLGTTDARNLVLAFIVSDKNDPCTPTWGSAYTMDQASEKLDLDRRIARLRQLGGDVAISFGGLLNDELAVKCTDSIKLLAAYKSVINRYKVSTIDFDIEGSALQDVASITRRAKSLAELQKEIRSGGSNLAIWLTLPVAPQGLTESGTNAVSKTLESGVDIAGINVMTMDYGESKPKNESMYQAAADALLETHRQLGILYTQNGINLNSESIWRKIGVTPMIGQNDVQDEIFNLEDAKNLNHYAVANGITRISMWSANRDVACGDNYVNLSIASDSCSGVKQAELDYSSTLVPNYTGSFAENISVTKPDPITESNVDDPTTSPYQIWSKEGAYLQGTKVVWHRNVYEAKWWTQGDLPDNPVLQSWQTPWKLIGPVLPGEKPIQKLTLPEGTYPEWSGTDQYNKGDRVLFEGVPYQAKWWTQGDSPAAATSNPNGSPWSALTQSQVEEMLKTLK